MIPQKILSLLLGLCLSTSVFAYEIKTRDGHERIVEIAEYSMPVIETKKALLRMLVNARWEILEHKTSSFLLEYKGAQMVIEVTPEQIVMREIPHPAKTFNSRWTASLRDHFLREIRYRAYVRDAIAMHQQDAEDGDLDDDDSDKL